MSGVAHALAWLLAVLLVWTGAAKLRRPGATAASFAALHLPVPWLLAIAVPAVELSTAGLLVAAPRLGAAVAGVLLVAFTAFLAARMRGRRTVACGCFGTARAEPVTSAALLRNTLLIVGSLVVVAVPPGPGGPPLEAVLAVGALASMGVVATSLWELRARTGRLWDNGLPTGPEGTG